MVADGSWKGIGRLSRRGVTRMPSTPPERRTPGAPAASTGAAGRPSARASVSAGPRSARRSSGPGGPGAGDELLEGLAAAGVEAVGDGRGEVRPAEDVEA